MQKRRLNVTLTCRRWERKRRTWEETDGKHTAEERKIA